MKAPLWTFCHYSRFWHKLRRNSKSCPHCGAVLTNSAHIVQEFTGNPNPATDPKDADTMAA